jgi:hypothetical protein
MNKRYYINDDVDLSDKAAILTADSFKTMSGSKEKTNDNRSLQIKTKDSMHYYAIVSTSGKIINNRDYSYDSLKSNVMDSNWTKPYGRPLLKNHDLYSSEPYGRMADTFFIDHGSRQIDTASSAKVPNEVIKHFDSIGAFADGTGSTIARFIVDTETGKKIQDGFYATASQSSFSGKLECSICGNNYTSEDCGHFAGREYTNDNKETSTCFVKSSDFEPIELSIVNLPANDTSVIIAYDTKKKTVCSDALEQIDEQENVIKDTIVVDVENKEPEANEAKFDETKNTCNDSVVKTEDKQEVSIVLKNLVKKNLFSTIKDNMSISEELEKRISDMYDGLDSDEKISDICEILTELVTAKQVATVVVADAVQEPVKAEVIAEPVVAVKVEDAIQVPTPAEIVPEKVADTIATEESKKQIEDTEVKKVEDLNNVYKKTEENFITDQTDPEILALLKNFN